MTHHSDSGLPKGRPAVSPYRRGDDDGFLFGILLSAMFFAGVFSFTIPLLGLISTLLALSVPFVIYFFLRRAYVADYGTTLLSSLWMQGIMIFACGSLIAGLLAMVYLKWINPDFFSARIAEAIEFYRSSGWESGERMADTRSAMVEARVRPSAVQMVLETIWLSIVSGSLLSLLMGLLARARAVPGVPR